MQHLVDALLSTKATPTLSASQSVWSVLSVPETKPVSARSAATPVLESAVATLTALQQITMPYASVIRATPATPSFLAKESPHVSLF